MAGKERAIGSPMPGLQVLFLITGPALRAVVMMMVRAMSSKEMH
jgi:hypothetical protein